jgi:hypothetical protein
MEASQHSLLAACFTLHSINATLAIVPQRGAALDFPHRNSVCLVFIKDVLSHHNSNELMTIKIHQVHQFNT